MSETADTVSSDAAAQPCGPRPGPAWQRRREAVAARVEAAALAAFAERGVDAVTVDEIAAAAGISRRTFYRYFDSPTAILATVLGRSMERWGDVVRARPAQEPLLTAFQIANAHAFSAPDNGGPLRQALQALMAAPDVWARISGPVQAHMARRYESVIVARLQAQGRSAAPAAAIAAALTAMLMQLTQEALRQHRMIETDEFETTIAVLRELLAPPT